jgi:hypothetical protein
MFNLRSLRWFGALSAGALVMGTLAVPAVATAAPSAPIAAVPPPPACQRILTDIAERGMQPDDLADLSKAALCFWEQFSGSEHQIQAALKVAGEAEKKASTTQTGAPSSSNGTTSAISKPITPLSLATEYGGITSSTSNQTMTLQTTLDGIPQAIIGRGARPYCWSPTVTIPECIKANTLARLNHFGLGVTANTSQSSQNAIGTAAPAQGTAQMASLTSAGSTAPSFASAFAKYAIVRGTFQIPTSMPDGIDLNMAGAEIRKALADPAILANYNFWQSSCIQGRFTAGNLADKANRERLYAQYFAQIGAILFKNAPPACDSSAPVLSTVDPVLSEQAPSWPQWQKDIANAVNNYIADTSVFEAQMQKATSSPILSIEYDYNTQQNQPTTSTLKVIGSKPFGAKVCATRKSASAAASAKSAVKVGSSSNDSSSTNRFTGTINAGASFYNSVPSSVPGASAFRDAQLGAELDTVFCTSTLSLIGSLLGNSTLGFTYYYQDQVSPSILKVTPGTPLPGISIAGLSSTATQVFTKKGPISFVQLKYGPGVGKNVKFPLAVSWSNRTDLITHALWRAQFGVSYDFSSLFASSNSNNGGGGAAQ